MVLDWELDSAVRVQVLRVLELDSVLDLELDSARDLNLELGSVRFPFQVRDLELDSAVAAVA